MISVETLNYCATGVGWSAAFLAAGVALGALIGEVRCHLGKRRRL